MNPVSFIFLIGKPGSGKTISAEILRSFFDRHTPDTPVVDIDDFFLPFELDLRLDLR